MLKGRHVPVAVALNLLAAVALAHPGRTDSSGGHNDRKHGGYHYHGGGPSAKPDPVPEKSVTASLARSIARESARIEPRTSYPLLRTNESRTSQSDKLGSGFKLNPEDERKDLAESPNVEEVADPKDEARASKLLDFAKRQRTTGNVDVATRWIRRIIADYSKTSSAKEARILLGEWKASEPFRTWKDVAGRYSIIAKFLRLDSGSVYLHTQGGKDIAVEIRKLCRNDQEYILNREGLN